LVLVLAHIPYGDGCRASDDTLNGLTADRVKDMLGQSEGLAQVFSAKPLRQFDNVRCAFGSSRVESVL
jgi:hypothetical protein